MKKTFRLCRKVLSTSFAAMVELDTRASSGGNREQDEPGEQAGRAGRPRGEAQSAPELAGSQASDLRRARGRAEPGLHELAQRAVLAAAMGMVSPPSSHHNRRDLSAPQSTVERVPLTPVNPDGAQLERRRPQYGQPFDVRRAVGHADAHALREISRRAVIVSQDEDSNSRYE